jgi:orotate phosphoribosyltransferase
MLKFKEDLILFLVRTGALKFGEFTTKAGRKSPYFINAGSFRSGEHIETLGNFYAIMNTDGVKSDFDILFGPAYKGIPLCISAACALYRKYNTDKEYCFNRKEAKDHGEGGAIVGAKLKDGDNVLIIEDVTTAGTSIAETLPLLKNAANVKVSGLIVSVNRQEKGADERSAFTLISQDYGITPRAIVSIDEIVEFGYKREVGGRILIDEDCKKRIDEYRNLYGAN